MSDYRIVQCFGVKRRPHKEAKRCLRKFRWTSSAMQNQFGGRGVQACPYCGTMPQFGHPYNRYLDGQITEEEAEAAMPDYIEKQKKEHGEK